MTNEANKPQNAESADEQRRKAKAKIRTIRIWFWVILSLLAGTFFLSQCAMSKPRAKQTIYESCVKNIPFAEKWQADLKQRGLADEKGRLVAQYCACMWDEPLDKLTEKQLRSFGKINPQEQLELLGGASAFEARDRQCIADLSAE